MIRIWSLVIGILWFFGFLYFVRELVMKKYVGEESKQVAIAFAVLFGALSIAFTAVSFS